MTIREMILYTGGLDLSAILRAYAVACSGLADAAEDENAGDGDFLTTNVDFDGDFPLRLKVTFAVLEDGFDVVDASIEQRVLTVSPIGRG